MNLPYGFVFENDNFAFLKLIAQPVFLADSGVESQDAPLGFEMRPERWTVQESFVKFFA